MSGQGYALWQSSSVDEEEEDHEEEIDEDVTNGGRITAIQPIGIEPSKYDKKESNKKLICIMVSCQVFNKILFLRNN